ncbi:hypothetical protein TraAM80_01491 [Trypanosoma rangeli]|uniref:Uncharacterized protein n=1 Tax=Trypanosoma rangeli TaxID=5698 RepID=A0A3S5ISB9_TRYRA|nr:uncharacterized protein TraAM80_01491 [Trypanosoma rangeli]RNF10565.1 hypothetical protein TraAM80_01491 [Trypanosoma rangeli]|eukprot:RNF10565.1 hypothetical protein TraAM80_01491 [Trypanosoma rangeli]
MIEAWKGIGKNSPTDAEEQNDEDHYLLSALRQLHAKLVAAQPAFTEEDVIVMAYPSPSGSPTHSPREQDADGEQDDFSWNAGTETPGRQRPVTTGTDNSNAVSSSPVEGAASSKITAVDKDKQLTSREFLAMVRNFDAKSLLRTRKAALDALRLLCDGYALTWRDTRHLPNTTLVSSAGSSRSAATATRDLATCGHASELPVVRRPSFALSSSFRVPMHSPSKRLVQLMGRCAESLLVYANESPSLRTMTTSNVTLLQLLCFVCSESRKLESLSSDRGWRNIDAELNELVSHWQSFSLTLPLLLALRECYLLEFLLDAALPPTVCSAKYDGIAAVLHEKKRRLMTEMMSSRTGFGAMTKGLPLRSLAAFVSMSVFAEPKLRARVLDRMTGEGLLQTLRSELTQAVADSMRLMTSEDAAPSSPTKLHSPLRSTGEDAYFLQSELKRVRGEKTPLTVVQDSPLRRLGYCLEVLGCLTEPNFARESTCPTTVRGVVRATAWASQLEDVQAICTCLLHLSALLEGGTPFSSLRPLQEQVMECVCQISSYSAVLYGVVVETLDDALSERGRGRASGQRDTTAPLLPLLVELLRLKQHADANSSSVGRWFTWLTECLVPQAFDVPLLTCNRTGNGRLWSRGARRRASTSRRDAPVLARNLRREEIHSLSPYFRFATRLVLETTWRHGAEPFLARIALLAYNVVLTQARRPNLVFGQASACYDAVAPLLETSYGVLPGESALISSDLFGTPTRSSGKSPGRSSQLGGKRSRSMSGGATGADDEVFVASPSQSPLFLEAYSPSALEAERDRDSDGGSRDDGSPSCGLTAPLWRQRLSLSVFLASSGACLPN